VAKAKRLLLPAGLMLKGYFCISGQLATAENDSTASIFSVFFLRLI